MDRGWLQMVFKLGNDGQANWPWSGVGVLEIHAVIREEYEGR